MYLFEVDRVGIMLLMYMVVDVPKGKGFADAFVDFICNFTLEVDLIAVHVAELATLLNLQSVFPLKLSPTLK